MRQGRRVPRRPCVGVGVMPSVAQKPGIGTTETVRK